MFSYRHGFHAGNHADVLKHCVLIQLLQYLNQKDTAYTYIDTHSGAGLYALDSGFASKSAEYESGIAPLWQKDDAPPMLAEYLKLIASMNSAKQMRYYPGSPFIAEKVMRDQDRLRLFELHPSEIKVLCENFQKLDELNARPKVRGKRTIIAASDGFDSLKALLPPLSKRALVLIDPSYEVKEDYRRVRQTLEEALKRFPGGMYAVWYPILQRLESRQLPEKLKRLGCKDWLNVSLSISGPSPDGFGLRSSGMFILNPPWTLAEKLKTLMPYLVSHLGQDKAATYQLEVGQA